MTDKITKDAILKQLPTEPISGICRIGRMIHCIDRSQACNISDLMSALGIESHPVTEDGEHWIEFD